MFFFAEVVTCGRSKHEFFMAVLDFFKLLGKLLKKRNINSLHYKIKILLLRALLGVVCAILKFNNL
ncbi:hypothetical protein CHX27_10730 [Flavobacterium aurantiibacter]|uniref:Uncharacterized protein n=1 Tax=Flavobacterium aurantiibacter TaxID=2023067 RepID=A0A255ZP83_9FLAO|nr:hypothetical protein CHX27_10730 [Flavobacterium aurantiibacter]